MLRPARAGRGGLRVGRRARCRQKLGLGLSPLEDRWSNCLFFMIAAGYQPPLANVATQPPWRRSRLGERANELERHLHCAGRSLRIPLWRSYAFPLPSSSCTRAQPRCHRSRGRTNTDRLPVGGELLLSPQSVEIIKFGDPGSGR